MLSSKISPFTEQLGASTVLPAMTMRHLYKNFMFTEVCSAFLRKYNEESRFTFTTICNVEQLDEDRFQLVRRIENAISSAPLYDRIIVDRKTMMISGFTFENTMTRMYSERYTYRQSPNATNEVFYDQQLFKNPGLKRVLRFKIHTWGVQNLQKILLASQKFRE